ncbi:hypothetical protein [Paraburkholderia bonniea]|uniref:hypothetical protein n=1 Tax=Paraburkholderia bonniea TaxID=2152891 RepID=UPI001292A00F|nr:hypothetical protein [Paraburkholderia bonniea]
MKSVGSKLETLSISGHRNNNSKNNGYTVSEPGDNRVMSYDMLKDMPHDEFVAMITDRLDGKDISLAAESNSKRNPGVAGGLDDNVIIFDSLSENANKTDGSNLHEKNSSNSLPAQELSKIQPSESSNNQDSVQLTLTDLIGNFMKEGAEVKDFEGIFNILSKNDTFPVINDIYEHCHPEKKLITSVIAVFSDKKTEVAAEYLILEEKNNYEKLKDFSDVVKNIFTECGLLESAKNGENISVEMNDEIPGSGPERKLMDLFIAYYLYLVSNNPAKYIGKLYRKLTFIDSDDSGGNSCFFIGKISNYTQCNKAHYSFVP